MHARGGWGGKKVSCLERCPHVTCVPRDLTVDVQQEILTVKNHLEYVYPSSHLILLKTANPDYLVDLLLTSLLHISPTSHPQLTPFTPH